MLLARWNNYNETHLMYVDHITASEALISSVAKSRWIAKFLKREWDLHDIDIHPVLL